MDIVNLAFKIFVVIIVYLRFIEATDDITNYLKKIDDKLDTLINHQSHGKETNGYEQSKPGTSLAD